jgi:hypothetical protein
VTHASALVTLLTTAVLLASWLRWPAAACLFVLGLWAIGVFLIVHGPVAEFYDNPAMRGLLVVIAGGLILRFVRGRRARAFR